MSSVSPETLTTAEAAKVIGCTRLHIYHLIRTGRLNAQIAGSGWRITTASATAYAETRRDA